MKCHRRLAKLREQGTAFVLVSHNSHGDLQCDEYLRLLDLVGKSQLIMSGGSEVVIHKYEEDLCLSDTEIATGQMILPEKPKLREFRTRYPFACFQRCQRSTSD
ncbi:hypothetical protein [Chroogloeocystis siderophila]|uniref:Uncharacterized protein n=1 Tax=Chroogloeocystis siderophila 5.2 s.c.1 TaxID=247279 RepID=A0A1U7HX00_9CHRO|nr:hypothetical protein [Chroogloeocystis siderophila]OKH28108.1 hypothetical protein NIES1031_05925 [Chroogloeocystis siderophila 5.2 s.c.1]